VLLFRISDLFAPALVRSDLLDARPVHVTPGALRWTEAPASPRRITHLRLKNGYHNAAN